MSHPNPERDERVRQIRERWSRTSFPEQVFTAHVKQDIDCLFSVLDSQKVLACELAAIVNVATDEDPGTSLLKLHKIQHDAATRMRDRCVEKVKGMRANSSLVSDDPFVNGVRATYNSVIAELESLTLEVEV